MKDYTANIAEGMTEEERNEVMLQAAREKHPHVPAHITVTAYMLRDTLHDIADDLEGRPGREELLEKVRAALILAGAIHFCIVDTFNPTCDGGETIQ